MDSNSIHYMLTSNCMAEKPLLSIILAHIKPDAKTFLPKCHSQLDKPKSPI